MALTLRFKSLKHVKLCSCLGSYGGLRGRGVIFLCARHPCDAPGMQGRTCGWSGRSGVSRWPTTTTPPLSWCTPLPKFPETIKSDGARHMRGMV